MEEVHFQNNITPDVHLFFSMGSPGPKINVVYFDEAIHFGEGSDEESGDEDGGEEEGGDEESGYEKGAKEDHPVDSAILQLRRRVTLLITSLLLIPSSGCHLSLA